MFTNTGELYTFSQIHLFCSNLIEIAFGAHEIGLQQEILGIHANCSSHDKKHLAILDLNIHDEKQRKVDKPPNKTNMNDKTWNNQNGYILLKGVELSNMK